MLIANLATLLLAKSHLIAVFLFQEDTSPVGWDPISLWRQMAWPARPVVIILFIMSAWPIGDTIDRWIAFSAARKQARQLCPASARPLPAGKLVQRTLLGEPYT